MEDRVLNSEEFRERAFEKVAERLKEGISSRPSPQMRAFGRMGQTGHLLVTAIALLENLEAENAGKPIAVTAGALAEQLMIAEGFLMEASEAFELALESQAAS